MLTSAEPVNVLREDCVLDHDCIDYIRSGPAVLRDVIGVVTEFTVRMADDLYIWSGPAALRDVIVVVTEFTVRRQCLV